MNKRLEILLLVIFIVIIPSSIYFIFFNQRVNFVCAHTFSDDSTATLLSIIEEYKQKLNLVNHDLNSKNLTMANLNLKDIYDQAYIQRIANYFYPNEAKSNGDLTKSYNEMVTMLSNKSLTNNEIIQAKSRANSSMNLLDECKKYFIDRDLTKNNTITSLTVNNILDSSFRYYDLATSKDSNGNVLSIKNPVDYQNSIALGNLSKKIMDQDIDKAKFSGNSNQMSLYNNLLKYLDTYVSFVKNKENYNKVMIVLHIDIKATMQKLFNLK